ncbi:COG1470 family protein [Methanocella conradii]|uniref:COG1470 family protein n=1 Tax=Methanocella conradii TaxID=1175444 RepID=UPI00157C591E|nr:NEW3 domain-containing protein [Methanocella conradii]
MKASIVPLVAICLIAGGCIAPALASTYSSAYNGWVESGKTITAGNCFVTFSISNGSPTAHVTVQSPDYPTEERNIPQGNSYYYYDALRIYVANVTGSQALVDISRAISSGSSSAGTKVWCDTPGLNALAGDEVAFPITIQNNNGYDVTYDLSASSDTWWSAGYLYNGKDVYKVYVPASQSRVVTLAVQTPYTASIGEKTITANIGSSSLDLHVYITSVNQSVEFSAKVNSIIASIGDKIYYDVTLNNLQSKENNYGLSVAGLPDNWYYRYVETRGSTSELAEAVVPAESAKSLVLEIVPPYSVSEGTYNFTAVVTTPDNVTISKDLTLRLKASSSMTMTSDKLAYTASPGQTFEINVYVTNSGTGSALTNVYPQISAPSGWVVSSSPGTVNSIKAGETQKFVISVQPPGNIVASDYEVTVTMTSDQAQKSSDYRITITTSSYVPYVGGGIIIAVLVGLVFLYKKYGRR